MVKYFVYFTFLEFTVIAAADNRGTTIANTTIISAGITSKDRHFEARSPIFTVFTLILAVNLIYC